MKIDGIRLLQMDKNGELKPRTIVRTSHSKEYFDGFKEYDYYIYFKDKQFHRCDENGKLGAKYQDRFLNYDVLRKEFEIIEEIEKPKKIEEIKMNGNEFYCEYIEAWIKKSESDAYGEYLSNKLNEVIDLVNHLLEKSDKDE